MATEYMPILGTPFAVRVDMLNEQQADANHGQTLARLAERGGLGLDEALAILERRRWQSTKSKDCIEAFQAAYAKEHPHG